jgi:hypothetical protein
VLTVEKMVLAISLLEAVLPDGIFFNQNSQFGSILEGLAREDVGIFYGHFVYFTAKWYILCPFGTFCGRLVYFPPFWYVAPRRIWQT